MPVERLSPLTVADAARPSDAFGLPRWLRATPQSRYPYTFAVLAIVAATLVCFGLFPFLDLANLIMVYILAVAIVATRLGMGPSTLAAVGGVMTFVYFFVPHYNSFVVADLEYLPTFATMFVVSMIVATRTSQLRAEVDASEQRESRSVVLYELSRDLAAAESRVAITAVVEKHLGRVFRCRSWLLQAVGDQWQPLVTADAGAPWRADAVILQQAVTEHCALRSGSRVVQPLVVTNEVVGVLWCDQVDAGQLQATSDQQLLASFAHNIAVALHRLVVGEDAHSAQQLVEEERLRNVMLSSVSHDLRTPLAAITGSITTLIDSGARLDQPTSLDLMYSIREDADTLERQVGNMLDLTRLESGAMQVLRDWHPVDEIVGGAMTRLERLLGDRQVDIEVPATLPLVSVDAGLIERMLVNIIENAVRYTPPDRPLTVVASAQGERLRLEVADRGPGVPAELRERIFAKFYRGTDQNRARGAGLGLAICRAIAHLHGGTIGVENRDGGGARFVVDLPVGGAQPDLAGADAAMPDGWIA